MCAKLMIIDVDSLMSIRSRLHPPRCLRASCDKSGHSYRGKDGGCSLTRWCAHAWYGESNILEYRAASNFTVESCYAAINPVLEKLQETDWSISFWTTRPRTQTFHIIRVLREAGIWERAQALSGTMLLLNNSELPQDGKFSPATEKLKLVERVYGKMLQGDTEIVAIESDPLEISVLQSYLGERVSVHEAPKIWMRLLVADRDRIDDVLRRPGRVVETPDARSLVS